MAGYADVPELSGITEHDPELYRAAHSWVAALLLIVSEEKRNERAEPFDGDR